MTQQKPDGRSLSRTKPRFGSPLLGLVISLAAIALLAAALGSPLTAPGRTSIDWGRMATYGFLFVLLVLVVLLGLTAWWLLRWLFEKIESPPTEDDSFAAAKEPAPTPRSVIIGLLVVFLATVGIVVYVLAHRRTGVVIPPVGIPESEPLPNALPPNDPLATTIVRILNVAVVLLAALGWILAAGIVVTVVKRRSAFRGFARGRMPEPPSASETPALPVADLEVLPVPLDGDLPPDLDARTRVIWCYQAFLWAMTRTSFGSGLVLAKLTPREFRRVAVTAFPDLAGPISDLTQTYERCRYGEFEMRDTDAEDALGNLERVRHYLAGPGSGQDEGGPSLER